MISKISKNFGKVEKVLKCEEEKTINGTVKLSWIDNFWPKTIHLKMGCILYYQSQQIMQSTNNIV